MFCCPVLFAIIFTNWPSRRLSTASHVPLPVEFSAWNRLFFAMFWLNRGTRFIVVRTGEIFSFFLQQQENIMLKWCIVVGNYSRRILLGSSGAGLAWRSGGWSLYQESFDWTSMASARGAEFGFMSLGGGRCIKGIDGRYRSNEKKHKRDIQRRESRRALHFFKLVCTGRYMWNLDSVPPFFSKSPVLLFCKVSSSGRPWMVALQRQLFTSTESWGIRGEIVRVEWSSPCTLSSFGIRLECIYGWISLRRSSRH